MFLLFLLCCRCPCPCRCVVPRSWIIPFIPTETYEPPTWNDSKPCIPTNSIRRSVAVPHTRTMRQAQFVELQLQKSSLGSLRQSSQTRHQGQPRWAWRIMPTRTEILPSFVNESREPKSPIKPVVAAIPRGHSRQHPRGATKAVRHSPMVTSMSPCWMTVDTVTRRRKVSAKISGKMTHHMLQISFATCTAYSRRHSHDARQPFGTNFPYTWRLHFLKRMNYSDSKTQAWPHC
jgi:hypothetical protein